MKNLIISAFCLSLLVGTAQAYTLKPAASTSISVQEKVAVRPEDLPEPVKTVLAGDTYAGWDITTAFLITKEDNTQFYEISLKKGEETSKVNLDKDGKKIE